MELERELERTRLEMRERQNKVNFSNGKKLEETAEKSNRKFRG
jgi:hypothetical protein